MNNETSQMKKYAVDVFKKIVSDWIEEKHFCITEYTVAPSPEKAINNIRHRIKQNYGWKNGDNETGSATVTYVFEAREAEEKEKKKKNIVQLNIFDFDFSEDD